MRWAVAAILLVLLAPGGIAASQVHATYLGDAYSVTFASNATGATLPVTWEGGRADAARVTEPAGDDDRLYRATLPAEALRYTIEGRTFALPAPPDASATTRIVFVADVGTDANASAIVRGILAQKPSLVIVGGDLSYANGNASLWNKWFDLMEPLAANVPTMPAYGNHEDYCPDANGSVRSCGPDANAWHAHFALPNGDKLYYAFDWGPIHFTVLDTEAYASGQPYTDRRAQETFLNGSLREAGERWNVVAYHRAVRTTNEKEGLEGAAQLASLAPLIEGRAPLALQAHAHAYERANEHNGTTFVTSGGGGRSLYDEWGPMEPWLAKRAAEFHFLVLDAGPTRIEVRALRPDGSTLDTFAIERDAPMRATPTVGTDPAGPPPTVTTAATAPSPEHGANNRSGENVSVGESNTPGVGLVAVVLVLTLSGRLTRRRALRDAR